jgi:hypothetical protein
MIQSRASHSGAGNEVCLISIEQFNYNQSISVYGITFSELHATFSIVSESIFQARFKIVNADLIFEPSFDAFRESISG